VKHNITYQLSEIYPGIIINNNCYPSRSILTTDKLQCWPLIKKKCQMTNYHVSQSTSWGWGRSTDMNNTTPIQGYNILLSMD